jgi:hypothetical protein
MRPLHCKHLKTNVFYISIAERSLSYAPIYAKGRNEVIQWEINHDFAHALSSGTENPAKLETIVTSKREELGIQDKISRLFHWSNVKVKRTSSHHFYIHLLITRFKRNNT